MESNLKIQELVIQKTRILGHWRVSPIYTGRMNRTTLGLPTGSGKQGPVVYWRKWGVFYDVDAPHVWSASPLKDFPTFRAAMAYMKGRASE